MLEELLLIIDQGYGTAVSYSLFHCLVFTLILARVSRLRYCSIIPSFSLPGVSTLILARVTLHLTDKNTFGDIFWCSA